MIDVTTAIFCDDQLVTVGTTKWEIVYGDEWIRLAEDKTFQGPMTTTHIVFELPMGCVEIPARAYKGDVHVKTGGGGYMSACGPRTKRNMEAIVDKLVQLK